MILWWVFPPPLEPIVPETGRFELLKAVKRVDEIAEKKKRNRPTEDEEDEVELGNKKQLGYQGNFQPIGQPNARLPSVKFQQDQGGRRSAGIVNADDWTGQWVDMSVEMLRTREVYRSDIKSTDWKTLMQHVGTLTFEQLGVSVLKRQGFPDLPVTGKLCLNTHVLGRHCPFERPGIVDTCEAAKNHTNPNTGHYVNMRLSAPLRATILLNGEVKKIPKRS